MAQPNKYDLWRYRKSGAVNRPQKLILAALVIAGGISMLYLFNWWFREEHIASLPLFLLLSLITLALRTRAAVSGDVFWETVPLMLLAVPILWENYLVLMVPFVFLAIQKIIKTAPIRLSHWIVLWSFVPVTVGLWPGLPPVFRTSSLAQVLGYSWPLYGLLAIALIGASQSRKASGWQASARLAQT